MLAFTDVRDARLGPLKSTAQAWIDFSQTCAKFQERCQTELTGQLSSSGWQGRAADRALSILGILDDEFELASMKTRTAASLLRSAADKFEQLQCYLHDTIYEATGLGLFVDDTGRVSPGRLEPTERNDPDTELFRRREAENARIYSDLIVTIVAEATEVDERIATALRELSPGFPGAEWEYNNARDGARNVAAILGLNEAGIPPPGKDPAGVHAWWNGLSADQRQVYLTAYPDRLGALDGLPAVDRDYANQLALRAYIGKNVTIRDDVGNDQHDTALMLLNKLEASESAPPDKRLYLLSLYPLGDGKAAVSIGNPDTADHTAVLIPGVGTELSGIRGLINRANALHEAATPPGSRLAHRSRWWHGSATTPRPLTSTSSPHHSAAKPKTAPSPSTVSSTDSTPHTTATQPI